MVRHNLLNILVCPACKGSLISHDVTGSLHCLPCGLAFPVRDGIPVMLLDSAEKIEPRHPETETAHLDSRQDGHKVTNQ